MTTEEMRNKIRDHCCNKPCKECIFNLDGCTFWKYASSKTVRQAFHKLFPDYFKPKNMHDRRESVFITINGNRVQAARTSNEDFGEARCSPQDRFDLYTGIDLAVRRMLRMDDGQKRGN